MPELLSRKDLINLWQEIASEFNSQLELPVDNGISLVIKFEFDHEQGVTEVKIKDLASAGSSLTGDASTFESSVNTTFKTDLRTNAKLALPPLFPNISKYFYKNVTPFYLGDTLYWIRADDAQISKNLSNQLEQSSFNTFRSLFIQVQNNQFLLKTSDFLGKKNQISDLISLHLSIIKIINR